MALIRKAAPADAVGIAHVHVTAWKETYRGLMPDEVLDALSVEQRTERWQRTLANPNDSYHLVLVAEEADQIIGFVNYGRELENDMIYQGEVYAIYVLKQFQGRGTGRALMKSAALGLREMGIRSMLVWVLADNPYRKFYEHLGGVYVREKMIQIGRASLLECAYGWADTRVLIGDEG
ncbi:MAG TPA: GNAT family N-acetyltransferase [Anaerolineales bacterium]|nr:GNAT family N-acetyltransferase [Anaerolineales bacterium]